MRNTNATGTHKDEHAQKPEQFTRVGAGPAPLPPLVAAADAADADARMMLAAYDSCCRKHEGELIDQESKIHQNTRRREV